MNYVSVWKNYKLFRTFMLTRHFALMCWIFFPLYVWNTYPKENYKLQCSLTFTNQHSNYIVRYLTNWGNMSKELFFPPLPLNGSQFFLNLQTHRRKDFHSHESY